MPRYEFDGRFSFPDAPTQASFASAVQTYITNNPTVFFGYTPVNDAINYHGTLLQHVQARFANHSDLDTLFATLKTQASTRGATTGSTMWLKTVADAGGVTEGVAADAPGWVDYPLV